MNRNRFIFYTVHSGAKPLNFLAGYALGRFGVWLGLVGFVAAWAVEFLADLYYWKNFDHALNGPGKSMPHPVQNHKNGKRFALAIAVVGVWALTGALGVLVGLGDFERFRAETGIFAGYALAYYFHAERKK